MGGSELEIVIRRLIGFSNRKTRDWLRQRAPASPLSLDLNQKDTIICLFRYSFPQNSNSEIVRSSHFEP